MAMPRAKNPALLSSTIFRHLKEPIPVKVFISGAFLDPGEKTISVMPFFSNMEARY
jgi:hypothetical protein